MANNGIANSCRERPFVGGKIIPLKREGKTTEEIVREVGVAKSMIKKWVSRPEEDGNFRSHIFIYKFLHLLH